MRAVGGSKARRGSVQSPGEQLERFRLLQTPRESLTMIVRRKSVLCSRPSLQRTVLGSRHCRTAQDKLASLMQPADAQLVDLHGDIGALGVRSNRPSQRAETLALHADDELCRGSPAVAADISCVRLSLVALCRPRPSLDLELIPIAQSDNYLSLSRT